jgi:hypothetical protein
MLTEKCDWGASLAASLLAKCLSNGAWFSKNATRRTFGTTEVKALLTGTRSLNGGRWNPSRLLTWPDRRSPNWSVSVAASHALAHCAAPGNSDQLSLQWIQLRVSYFTLEIFFVLSGQKRTPKIGPGVKAESAPG